MTTRKKITLSSVAVVLIGLSVLTYVRWGAWFGNPPEDPYAPLPTPGRVLLTFGNSGELSRNISWQCDSVLLPAHVELTEKQGFDTLRIAAKGEIFASRSGKAAYYVARLDNLIDGTDYRYRVVTDGRASQWYDFSTTRQSNKNFSFLFFGDVQDSIGGQTHRLFSEAVGRHAAAEFVVLGGDLIERPTDAYWSEAFRGIDSVAQSLPILAVTGNHEYLKYPIRKLERRFSLVFSYFLDAMVGENQVYTLTYRDAQFYLLDSNRELPFLITQQQWLKQELARSTARWNIVVLHHPVHSVKSSSNNLMQRLVFGDLIRDNVDLVLQGHEHAYARMTAHDGRRPVPPIYTVSHCSPKHYRFEFNPRFDRYGCGSQYYQRIDISGDTLRMNTYDANTHALYDGIDIVKGEHDIPHLIDRAVRMPEKLNFTPRPGNKKDAKFMERLREYKSQKGIR